MHNIDMKLVQMPIICSSEDSPVGEYLGAYAARSGKPTKENRPKCPNDIISEAC